MHEQHAPWAVQAWQHWHRPWAVTHASWLQEADLTAATGGCGELALRLHYPAWCRRYALEPGLAGFDDSLWWRLFGLAQAPFDRVAQRVGLTLAFAANRRRRLQRDDAVHDVATIRWALERAHFVPESVVAEMGKAASPVVAAQHAAHSLRACLVDEAPALWARMGLRFPREHVDVDAPPARLADTGARGHLTKLWAAAARSEQQASDRMKLS